MILLPLLLMLTVNSSSTMIYANANEIRRTESMIHTIANEIRRTNTNALRRTDTKIYANSNETQRIEKRHISKNTFRAFECNEQSDLSTAEFSLNEPPACRRSDGSAYHPPEPKKAQILQKRQRIPIEVTICQVKLRILVGWCGGEYVAMNYMHSFVETQRTLI